MNKSDDQLTITADSGAELEMLLVFDRQSCIHTAYGRRGVCKARMELVMAAHMARDPRSFCVDSLNA